jgi:hypothetical protein
MFGIRPFLCGLLAGACGGLFATNFHVVNTPQGVVVVPRTQQPPLRSSYVDIRNWSEAMWASHPEVTAALVADGRSSLIGENLKDNLLDHVLPKQTRSTTRRNETIPAGRTNSVAAKSNAADDSMKMLDSQSTVRKRWEAALDKAIAPMVDEDPAELAADQPSEVLPETSERDRLVQQLEEKFKDRVPDPVPATETKSTPTRIEALPTSGDPSDMARDLLKQVIPQGGKSPNSAAPLRDLGHSLLNAPAPGQGAAAQAQSRVPVQSQLIQSEPF